MRSKSFIVFFTVLLCTMLAAYGSRFNAPYSGPRIVDLPIKFWSMNGENVYVASGESIAIVGSDGVIHRNIFVGQNVTDVHAMGEYVVALSQDNRVRVYRVDNCSDVGAKPPHRNSIYSGGANHSTDMANNTDMAIDCTPYGYHLHAEFASLSYAQTKLALNDFIITATYSGMHRNTTLCYYTYSGEFVSRTTVDIESIFATPMPVDVVMIYSMPASPQGKIAFVDSSGVYDIVDVDSYLMLFGSTYVPPNIYFGSYGVAVFNESIMLHAEIDDPEPVIAAPAVWNGTIAYATYVVGTARVTVVDQSGTVLFNITQTINSYPAFMGVGITPSGQLFMSAGSRLAIYSLV